MFSASQYNSEKASRRATEAVLAFAERVLRRCGHHLSDAEFDALERELGQLRISYLKAAGEGQRNA